MKKIILSAAFAMIFGLAFSQNTEVTPAAKTAFSSKFGSINPVWVSGNDGFRANFTQDGKDHCALFNSTGAFIHDAVKINLTDLPEAVKTDAQNRFNPATFEECRKVTLANGTDLYEYQYVQNGSHIEVYYFADGKMQKRNVYR